MPRNPDNRIVRTKVGQHVQSLYSSSRPFGVIIDHDAEGRPKVLLTHTKDGRVQRSRMVRTLHTYWINVVPERDLTGIPAAWLTPRDSD